MWERSGRNSGMVDQLVAMWNGKSLDRKINLTYIPHSEMVPEIAQAIVSGEVPDLMGMDINYGPQFEAAGQLTDITDMTSSEPALKTASPGHEFPACRTVRKGEVKLADGTALSAQQLRDGQVQSNAPIELGIRPEHIHLVKAGGRNGQLNGIVLLVERLGNSSVVHLETACGPLAVQCGGDLDIAAGQKVFAELENARMHLFGSDGAAI